MQYHTGHYDAVFRTTLFYHVGHDAEAVVTLLATVGFTTSIELVVRKAYPTNTFPSKLVSPTRSSGFDEQSFRALQEKLVDVVRPMRLHESQFTSPQPKGDEVAGPPFRSILSAMFLPTEDLKTAGLMNGSRMLGMSVA